MQANKPISQIFLAMAIFVIAGIPLVAFLWHTLNDALALQLTAGRGVAGFGVLLLFLGLLWLLAKFLQRW